MKCTLKRRRARRAAQREQGVVLLIVVLLLTMSISTALYAMRATSGEQRSAGELSDGAWARSLSEGMAMAAMGYEEQTTAAPGSVGNCNDLDIRWQSGGLPAPFSARYGIPSQACDKARSIDGVLDVVRFPAATFPLGAGGFMLPRNGRGPSSALIMRSPKTADYRSVATRLWTTITTGLDGQTPPAVRSRTIITGIGETRAPGDATDSIATTGQRGSLTTIGMTRAYLDTLVVQ